MSRTFGYILLLIALAVGLYVASRQLGVVSKLTDNHPQATVELTGVRNDLVAIAHAEQRAMASNGKYVSLEELISSGELNMPSTSRGPYTYSVEVTESGFIASATAENPPAGAPRVLRINDQISLTQE